ncbi:hypothetical protein [Serinicoccus marinus]|uniref:hypothetical protein n=1 Tax=Serinicoccus marinus TaxID=247333 RepID=UPI001375B6D1|nr:hypothetical protein [Serinicoccus marinus]
MQARGDAVAGAVQHARHDGGGVVGDHGDGGTSTQGVLDESHRPGPGRHPGGGLQLELGDEGLEGLQQPGRVVADQPQALHVVRLALEPLRQLGPAEPACLRPQPVAQLGPPGPGEESGEGPVEVDEQGPGVLDEAAGGLHRPSLPRARSPTGPGGVARTPVDTAPGGAPAATVVGWLRRQGTARRRVLAS